MKNIFKKVAENVRTNLECRETRIVSILCVGIIAFSVTVIAMAPLIK